MKSIFFIFLTGYILATLKAQEISSPVKRMAIVDSVRILLTTEPVIDDAEVIEKNNPFNRKGISKDSANISGSPSLAPVLVTNKDRLAALAHEIRPNGTAQLGGNSILMVGQKKFRLGDIIPVVFQGVTYELKIVAIDKNTFTLRLNSDEFTRPIKPSSNK